MQLPDYFKPGVNMAARLATHILGMEETDLAPGVRLDRRQFDLRKWIKKKKMGDLVPGRIAVDVLKGKTLSLVTWQPYNHIGDAEIILQKISRRYWVKVTYGKMLTAEFCPMVLCQIGEFGSPDHFHQAAAENPALAICEAAISLSQDSDRWHIPERSKLPAIT